MNGEITPREVSGPATPPTIPGGEHVGPAPDLGRAIEEEHQALARGWEPQQTTITFPGGLEGTATLNQPIQDLTTRRERLQGLRDLITQQGTRLLADQNLRIDEEYHAQYRELEALAEGLHAMVAGFDARTGDLGEHGELTADEYRQGLNEYLQQQRHLLTRIKALQGQQEEHQRRRTQGGYAVMLEALNSQPSAATELVNILRGEPFTVQPYRAEFEDVDLEHLRTIRDKVQRRINQAENVHRQLAERDARRGNISAPTQAQLNAYPALRSRQ